MVKIFIDGWCPHCRRFGRIVKKVDFFSQVVICDIRAEDSPLIDKEKALKSMASITKRGETNYGFLSIYKLFKTIPILWIFVPLFFVLKITTLGNILYNELAVRRKIIPLHCDEACEYPS